MGTKTSRKRRQRRQMRAMLKHGVAAKPSHRLRSGRTGQVHSKKIKSRRHE